MRSLLPVVEDDEVDEPGVVADVLTDDGLVEALPEVAVT